MAGNTYKKKTVENVGNQVTANKKQQNDKKTSTKKTNKIDINLKDKINLLKDKRLHLVLGIFLLLFSFCLLLAFSSYLFVGDLDQSFFGSDETALRADGKEIQNVLGWSGAALAQLFVYRWFGLGAYLLIPILFLYGLQIVYQIKFEFIFRLSKALLFFSFWISFLLGNIAVSYKEGDFITYICGGIGYEWGSFLSDTIGFGAFVLVIFSLVVFLIYYFDITSLMGLTNKSPKVDWTVSEEEEEYFEEEEIKKEKERPINESIETKKPIVQKEEIVKEKEPIEEEEFKLIIKEDKPVHKEPIEEEEDKPIFEPSPFDVVLDELDNEKEKRELAKDPITNFEENISIEKKEEINTNPKEENDIAFPKRDRLISIDSNFGVGGDDDIKKEEIVEVKEEKPIQKEEPIIQEEKPIIVDTPVRKPIELKTEITEQFKKDELAKKDLTFEVQDATTREEEFETDQLSDYYKNVGEKYDPTRTLANFKLPTLAHLDDRSGNKVEVSEEELNANKDRIVNTLRNYKIEIKSIKATIGPTVTLYEIVPEDGVKISKIRSLEDDIALSLSALGIRIIAPIPGKGTIGIEVPNTNREIVSARSVLGTRKFQESTMALPVVFGRTISNEVFMMDLAKMPHLLMAGATGQGKSVGLNILLASLLYKKHPAQLKFVLIDPKKVEFSIFEKIEQHYLAKLPDSDDAIITDTSKVIYTLNSLCNEMDMRYDLLKDARCRNLKEYNEKFIERRLNPDKGHKFMPYIVVIIDELADLMMTAGKEVEAPIARLAQLARAIGIHLVVATQRPSVNVITGVIKANFPARVSFRVSSKIDSRTILDAGGADQLVGMGDMLFTQGMDLIRLQCAFIDTPEIERLVDHIGNQQGYPTAFLLPEVVEENEAKSTDVDLSERDVLFDEAAKVIVLHQQGSTSLLQRKLKLGYNRAGRLIDQLESAGIVGPFEGSKARAVYVSDEYSLEQLLSNLKNK